MAVYFRTWKMSVAALIALAHDLILTAGIYGIVGFEVTPAAVIGFLTILGYSLYDTVVVFDKVRENTERLTPDSPRTFAETVNLAVNQTLVRSINTSIVALLPIAAILFIGAVLLGAGTLRDISLALFIGIIVGTYSTIFVAAPLYVDCAKARRSSADDKQKTAAALHDDGCGALISTPESGTPQLATEEAIALSRLVQCWLTCGNSMSGMRGMLRMPCSCRCLRFRSAWPNCLTTRSCSSSVTAECAPSA